MESPLSQVIANFYMAKLEQQALKRANLKPSTWLRYVDDTFVIWNHGDLELRKFNEHLYSICPSIQFTMEREEEKLSFLDVMVV